MITTFILLSIISSFIPIKWYPKRYRYKLYDIKRRTGLNPSKYFLKVSKYLLYDHSKKLRNSKRWYRHIILVSLISTRFFLQIAIRIV